MANAMDLGRTSIAEWAKSAPEEGVAELLPAKQKFTVESPIGKGGMGPKTLQGLADHGAVYLHAVGGAAQVLARAIPKVEKVFMLSEFGVPEALWVIEVERFPVMVTMDSHGGSLHDEVEERSQAKLRELLGFAV